MNILHFSKPLTITSWIFVSLGILCSLIILIDLIRHPQKMKIMNPVWVLNALWGSILILLMYFFFGRNTEKMHMDMSMDMSMDNMSPKDIKTPHMSQKIATGTLHCGAGCTLSDIISSFLFYVFPFTLFTSITLADWTLAYILALLIGVTFQYAALAPMKSMYPQIKTNAALWFHALKIDFVSLSAWQIGMYGWMAISIYILFGRISPTRIEFWFMMQIAMCAGFCCAYPVNYILIKKGIKKPM